MNKTSFSELIDGDIGVDGFESDIDMECEAKSSVPVSSCYAS